MIILLSVLYMQSASAQQVAPQMSLDQTPVSGCKRLATRDPQKAGSDKSVTIGCITADNGFQPSQAIATVEPKGASADSSPAINAAASLGRAVILGPTGEYRLNTNVNVLNRGFFGVGANVTGTKYLPTTDEAARRQSFILGGLQSDVSDNRFTAMLSIEGKPSGTHSVDYEKAALILKADNYDPSIYSSVGSETQDPVLLNFRDVVGVEIQSQIMAGNLLGRSWGVSALSAIQHGGDGMFTGYENRIENNGSGQPFYATATSKASFQAISAGTANLTNAYGCIAANASAARFYDCYMTDQAAVDRYAYVMWRFFGGGNAPRAVYAVDKIGDVVLRRPLGGDDAQTKYILDGIQAYSIGLNNASRQLRITGVEGVNSPNDTMIAVKASEAVGLFGDAQTGGGKGVVYLKNATIPPTSNPTGGGLLFGDNGDLKWRDANGAVISLGYANSILGAGLTLKEAASSAIATPAAGTQTLFIDSADHKFKRKDSSGTVTTIN